MATKTKTTTKHKGNNSVDASQSEISPVPSQSNKISTKTEAAETSRPVLKPMEGDTSKPKTPTKPSNKLILVSIAVVVLLFGSASGYALALMQRGDSAGGSNLLASDPDLQREVGKDEITKGTKVGIADENTFDNSAEGTIQKGGIQGEGSHHLVREGGEDQTLYMTSSVIDLDQFIDRKVKVWGETLGAQKAGWLMDVGKLEVLE